MKLFDKFSSPPVALAMLGNLEIVKKLDEIKVFDNSGIKLLVKDFVMVDELIQGISDTKNASYVLLSDMAFNSDDEKRKIIEEIRKYYPDILIAIFFNHEKPDPVFKNWAFGMKVYNLYYTDENGVFDFLNIVPEIKNTRDGLPTTSDELSEAKERELSVKLSEIKSKENELSEREKELDNLRIELEDKLKRERELDRLKLEGIANTEIDSNVNNNSEEIASLKEKISEAESAKNEARIFLDEMTRNFEREKEKLKEQFESDKAEYKRQIDADVEALVAKNEEKIKALMKENEKQITIVKGGSLSGLVSIAVFSLSRGAGSTYTSVCIAERLVAEGYKTALIAFDGKDDLIYTSDNGNADYFVPKNNKDDKQLHLRDALSGSYDFIIYDFGEIFPIASDGKFKHDANHADIHDDINELLRCNYKIGLGFSDVWHINKLLWFTDNSDFDTSSFLFSIEGISGIKGLSRSPLFLCERDCDTIIETLHTWLGLIRENEKRQSRSQNKSGLISKITNRKEVVL